MTSERSLGGCRRSAVGQREAAGADGKDLEILPEAPPPRVVCLTSVRSLRLEEDSLHHCAKAPESHFKEEIKIKNDSNPS